jgi:hypothetical protein
MPTFYVSLVAQLSSTVRVPHATDEAHAQEIAAERFGAMARTIRNRHAGIDAIEDPQTVLVSPYPPGFRPAPSS